MWGSIDIIAFEARTYDPLYLRIYCIRANVTSCLTRNRRPCAVPLCTTMSKQEPEIIDLTATPQPPEVIVIDYSDDECLPATPPQVKSHVARVNRQTETPRKRGSKSPSSREEANGSTAHGSSNNHRTNPQHDTERAVANGKPMSSRSLETNTRHESRRDKKRRREGRSRDTSASRRSRSRSRDRRRAAVTPDDGTEVFFVDVAPTPVTTDVAQQYADARASRHPHQSSKLLLPAHVSVLDSGANAGKVPIKMITPSESVEDYIEYLDYDDFKVAHRTLVLRIYSTFLFR